MGKEKPRTYRTGPRYPALIRAIRGHSSFSRRLGRALFERHLALFHIRINGKRVAGRDFAIEQFHGQRVLDEPLDGALEGPGAELRVAPLWEGGCKYQSRRVSFHGTFIREIPRSGHSISVRILPQHENAVIPIEKLRDYALDPNHPLGKNKARVFRAALGIGREEADILSQILNSSLPRSPAVEGLKTPYGQHWTTYHEIIGLSGQTVVVTAAWIYRIEQADVPVLISCYIEPQGLGKHREALSDE